MTSATTNAHHLEQCLGRPEHPERPNGDGPVQESARSSVAGVITWAPAGSAPERYGRQCVGADVEREDLQHAEREREAPPDSAQITNGVSSATLSVRWYVRNRRALANVARPCFDRGDDRGEVVVEQHEVGGLASDVAAARAHGDADVGLPQCGPVVHAVAGHRDHVPTRPECPSDPELVLGRHPGDHHAVAIDERAEHLLVGGQLGAGQHESVGRSQARLVGDGLERLSAESPVIIATLMPARRQAARASRASGRGGSSKASRPSSSRSASASSTVVGCVPPVNVLAATASRRRPRSDSVLHGRSVTDRRSSSAWR